MPRLVPSRVLDDAPTQVVGPGSNHLLTLFTVWGKQCRHVLLATHLTYAMCVSAPGGDRVESGGSKRCAGCRRRGKLPGLQGARGSQSRQQASKLLDHVITPPDFP